MDTDDGIYIINAGRQVCLPGYAFGPAVRDHYLIHFISAGRGRYEVGDKAFELSAGEGFIIYPGARTLYRADRDAPWTYQWVDFYGREADALMARCGFRYGEDLTFSSDKGAEICTYLADIAGHYNAPEENDRLAATGYLYLFLSQIARARPKYGYVETVTQYIQLQYAYPITVADMAARVGLNRSYLCKIFKASMDVSPQEYLLDFRMGRAKCLLRETDLPVAEVAYSCGFRDFPHFSTQFKKREGVSPGHYRRTEKGKPVRGGAGGGHERTTE